MGVQTNFLDSTGQDIGAPLVDKSYLIDRYPELANTFKQAGLWLVGGNYYGQLGTNNITDRSSPVQTVSGGANWKQVVGGSAYTAAIKTDGTLWLWGRNSYGQLGANNIVDRSSPVQTVSGGTNWKQVSCGLQFTMAIKTDGTLWGWGRNLYGQLGNNSVTGAFVGVSSPVQTVSGGTNWKQVSCGDIHTAAIKTDGTLWVWGRNTNGQLGTNNLTIRSSPVQTIAGGTNWRQVSGGDIHTAAIKTDGTLWLWGNNDYGPLGTNDTASRSSPVQTVSGGTNWKLVACGAYHTAAIKTDGTLWSWGFNFYGGLGTNDTTPRSSPVQTVSGGTNWKLASSGKYYTAAIKTDGTLWLWGYNNYGQIGTNNLTGYGYSSPVQTVSAGTNWKQVSANVDHITAIRDDSEDYI